MARRFSVLQIGGQDLEHLFNQNSEVAWDYFDTQLFDFESHFVERMTEIIESEGAFDLVFIQTPLVEPLIELMTLVITPYNTIVDGNDWHTGYAQLEIVKKYRVQPIYYTDVAELHDRLIALAFP
ncbi:TPA: accessory Sec system protein Asp2, partial [Staphylococcus delphini]|nr:accessory Sec system protein Asp2 [Staphylococcus delphini]